MKITVIFLALSFVILIGCSTNYNYPSKKITVLKISGEEQEYGLLSVRGDSSVVVLNWKEAKVTPIPFSHAEVLKRDSIIMISRAGQGGGGTNAGKGALIGAGAGGIGGLIFSIWYNAAFDGFGVNTSISSWLPFYTLFIVACAGAGALIGAFIGNAIPPSKELHLSSDTDRAFLRSISAYPDKEPDEMKYIK